jgi:hypothetical protein
MPQDQDRRPIALDHFIEVTMQSVLRALIARKLPVGPILVGLIYRPGEGLRGEVDAPRAARRVRRRRRR